MNIRLIALAFLLALVAFLFVFLLTGGRAALLGLIATRTDYVLPRLLPYVNGAKRLGRSQRRAG